MRTRYNRGIGVNLFQNDEVNYMENTKQKLILAILQGDDYADTVDELNQNGFFCHHP